VNSAPLAAVRVLPSRKGVEVWMADATTGRTLTRQLVVDERAAGPDNTLVAMQTAELLRTGLFPKADSSATPPATPVATVQVVPAPPPRTDAWRLRNGLGALYSPGGVDTGMQDWLTMQRWWHHDLGVALSASLPVLRGSISGPEGRSLIGPYLGALELCTSFLEKTTRTGFSPAVWGVASSCFAPREQAGSLSSTVRPARPAVLATRGSSLA
jgi:hypothetical protein